MSEVVGLLMPPEEYVGRWGCEGLKEHLGILPAIL